MMNKSVSKCCVATMALSLMLGTSAQGAETTKTETKPQVSAASGTAPGKIGTAPINLAADPHKVIKECDAALKEDPENAAAYDTRGAAYNHLEQYQQALKDFNEAIRLDPELATAYANRAYAYLELNKLPLALKDANEAIRLNPNLGSAYTVRGSIYRKMEKYAEAQRDHAKGLQLSPKDASSHINMSATQYMLKNYAAAIHHATVAIGMNPNDDVAYDNRGLAYHQLRQFQKAIRDYNKAISLKPNEAKYICHRGISYAEMGQHERAIKDFNEAIRLKPNFALAYFDRGLSHYFMHEFQKSHNDIQDAIRFDHRYALALIQLPIDPTKGAKEKKPITDPSDYYYRATTRIFLIKNETALSDLRKYLDLTNWQGELAPSAAIMMYLGHRLNRQTAQASAVLNQAAQKLDPNIWPYPIIRYLKKEISADAVLAKATDRDQQTDAHSFIGIDMLWSGQRKNGLDHINWVMSKGNGNLVSYSLAVREREKLQIRKSRMTEKV